MDDPLGGFDWASLYGNYDECCAGFNPRTPHLARFGSDRPASDRMLYYRLIAAYSPAGRARESDPVGMYKALLYWKLYSQHTTPSMFRRWCAEGGGFDRATIELPRLLAALPPTLNRDIESVVGVVQGLGKHALPGMQSAATVPVRTTFLHFIFPSSVPIFDRMVLRAVGECGRDANKSYEVLREYLPFAWRLADKYAAVAGIGRSESPLRLLDMALWVNRGAGACA
jgi:hypothetical protein